MSVIDVYQKKLGQLPPAVQAKMDGVGLRNSIERLLDCLRGDGVPQNEETQQLHQLIDWTLSVLSSAAGPLENQTFEQLHSHFSDLAQYAQNGQWQDCLVRTRPILEQLSVLPTTIPRYSLEAAQALNTELRKATTTLTTVEDSFRQSAKSRKQALAEEARVVSTRFNRLTAVATGRFKQLKTTATDEHENLLTQMTDLLDKLKTHYGFTAGQVLGGAHDLAAQSEKALAESHGNRSRRAMWGAIIWAAAAQIWWLTPWAPDWEQWFDALRSLPIVGSPIVILLFVAKREGRVAAEHRNRHANLRSLELQLKSWQPYRDTLSDLSGEHKLELEHAFTRRVFPGDTSPEDSDS